MTDERMELGEVKTLVQILTLAPEKQQQDFCPGKEFSVMFSKKVWVSLEVSQSWPHLPG